MAGVLGQWGNKRQNNFLESPSELLKSKLFSSAIKKVGKLGRHFKGAVSQNFSKF